MKWYLYNPDRDDAFIAIVNARSKEEAAMRFSMTDTRESHLSKEDRDADIESLLDQYVFVPETEIYDIDQEVPSINLLNAKKAQEQIASRGYVQSPREKDKPKKARGLDLDIGDIDLDVEDIDLDAGQLKIPDVKVEEINLGI